MSAFMLISSHVGPLIINAYDEGVANQVIATGTHEPDVIDLGCLILDEKRKLRGDGVHALDVGAHIGTCTMGWANYMVQWGHVTAYEAQERVYYALAGGIALNNAENASAHLAAVTNYKGTMRIPKLDHNKHANFGGLALLRENQFQPKQPVSFKDEDMVDVQTVVLDDIAGRVDYIKIDIEGMEPHALEGAQALIAREKPVIVAEYLHCGPQVIKDRLPGYDFLLINCNVYCTHPDDRAIWDLLKSKIS